MSADHTLPSSSPLDELRAIILEPDLELRTRAAQTWGKRWLTQAFVHVQRPADMNDQDWAVKTGAALHELAEEVFPKCLLRKDVPTALGVTTTFAVVFLRREPNV